MTKTNHEIDDEMIDLNSMLVFLDKKIHDLVRLQVRAEDKYIELKKLIEKQGE